MAGSFSAHVRRVTVALFVLQVALLPMMAIASDADPEQDFCVADPTNPTIVNGLVCKNPALVKASDFMFTGLANPGNTNNPLGSSVTPAAAAQFPGINTLGIPWHDWTSLKEVSFHLTHTLGPQRSFSWRRVLCSLVS
jgi:hypothetical protein